MSVEDAIEEIREHVRGCSMDYSNNLTIEISLDARERFSEEDQDRIEKLLGFLFNGDDEP